MDAVGELKDNNAPFRIGRQSTYGGTLNNAFNGGIDDISIYNRELTPDEIIYLYNE